METPEERLTKAREIYDHHIMVEMLAHSHVRLALSTMRLQKRLELYKGIAAARSEEPYEEPSSAGSLPGTFFPFVLLAPSKGY